MFSYYFSSCKDKAADASSDAAAATDQALATTEGGVTATPVDPSATTTGDAQTPAVPTGPITTLKFDNPNYDWGKINDGEKVTHLFKFTNTGKEPLIISDAKGSCGCTVPEWPKEPIAPGAKGEIKVVFDSKGKGSKEGKLDTKKVTITANTDPAQTFLNIQGIVVNPNAPQ
ncbi:MAG: DUF1573 domain-containing protein [Saprospiraceae bacterium]|nr:DUF1573 domain-containing protein [Saprospiraceae bacterium]